MASSGGVQVAGEAIEVVCGQLLFVGFDGTELPRPLAEAFGRGHRGGAILFKRNVARRHVEAPDEVDLLQVAELNAAIVAAAPSSLPPVIGVDQEGGRVKRLGPPVLQVPPMRSFGDKDPAVVEQIAKAVGEELAALGFSMSFAPVLDVDSNPNNPVIGDRSFARDPEAVARLGIAYARGLARASVLACGKHFPGHGDTEEDSHLSLPRVRHDRARIDAIELAPFREAMAAGVLPSIMTAHVIFDAIDPDAPATLSTRAMQRLLREELRYDGVCISDDLFMKGVSPSGGADASEVARAGVRAIEAGCDMLLVCHAGPAADACHAALVARAREDAAFEARAREAFARGLAMRARVAPRPIVDVAELRRRVGAQTLTSIVCGC
ncbi:MAG: beta-N-acetylhexosaminidase [Deltaproteobacteria bacterium]|nr:beta-N-acetylhexosaminidase [Deltaproteobacteria bacterium]